MTAKSTSPITFTETEVRSVLPSGWAIAPGSAGRWDVSAGNWTIDVLDGAEQRWTVEVGSDDVEKGGRLAALDARIRRIERKGLGRKSVISG